MEKLYGIQEIMARYGCKERKARDIMREMGTLPIRPMMVRESDIEAWEQTSRQRKEEPVAYGRKARKPVLPFPKVQQGPLKPGQHISRVRPKAIGE